MKIIPKYVNRQILSEQKGDFYLDYFENGAVKSVGKKLENLEQGEWKYYRKNGQLWQTGNFKNGLKTGQWIKYNWSNEIISEKNY